MLNFIFKTVPKAIEREAKKAVFGLLLLLFKRKRKVEQSADLKKILIIYPESALGDMISRVALHNTLKASFHESKIDAVVVRKSNRMVLDNNNSIRRIYFWETDHRNKFVFSVGFLWLALKLRKEKYDLAVTPSSDSLRYAMFCRLTGAKRCVGFSSKKSGVNHSELFLTDTFPEDNTHFVEKHQKLGAYIAGSKALIKKPELILTEQENIYAERFWQGKGVNIGDLVVGVHPFYGPHKAKGYSAENFGKVFEIIKESVPKAKLAVFWGPTEAEGMPEILKLAEKNILTEDVDFRKLAALLRRPDVFICCNTGTSHLASLADIPVILLCEPTLFWVFDPWGTRGNVIRTETAFCNDIKPEAIASLSVQLLKKYSPLKL